LEFEIRRLKNNVFTMLVALAVVFVAGTSAQAGEHMFGPTGIYGTLDRLWRFATKACEIGGLRRHAAWWTYW